MISLLHNILATQFCTLNMKQITAVSPGWIDNQLPFGWDVHPHEVSFRHCNRVNQWSTTTDTISYETVYWERKLVTGWTQSGLLKTC